MRSFSKRFFTRENLLAFGLFVLVVLLLVVTSDRSPLFIYQRF